MHKLPLLTAAAWLIAIAAPASGASFYPNRLDDPKAVYLTPENFAVKGDGVADDTAAIQAAIDRVQETAKQGVLFVPEGTYRLTKTLNVWAGIRLIGYGAHRPTFVLGENTPGYQEGERKYLVHFVSHRPPPGRPIADANPGTFYSAMSNIDIEIRPGNPAAIGVRCWYAQHSFLSHMDFRVGQGRAALEDIGNEAEDLHFFGGDYGIITRKPSPGWQYTLVDSHFEGQRVAAIKCQEAGLTLIRDTFAHVPTVISINPNYAEELWMKSCRFEDVSGPAVIVSDEHSARTEINLEDVVCERVPHLVHFRESGTDIAAPGAITLIRAFSHGLHYADVGTDGEMATTHDIVALDQAPALVPSDIPALPDPATWVNVHTLGVKGDGQTDDTAALRSAIAQNRTLYLPSGRYRVSDTIELRPDTVLIGLSPIATVFALDDASAGYAGPGTPKPLLEAPRGGNTIVTGIGIDTGGQNPRAVGAKWMAGEHSYMNDVRFLGGHGTYRLDGTWDDIRRSWEKIYNNTHTADPDPKRHWDSEYPSLWITQGGGGTFKDIWTPSTFAQCGTYICDTSTPGRIYQMSVEHHVRNEVKFRNVSHWQIYALQMEEERGESAQALPLEIEGCSDLTFANTYFYRVVSSFVPFGEAVTVADSRDIRFRNFHCYSDSKVSFDAALVDTTQHTQIRQREFARLDISGDAPAARPARSGVTLARGAKLEKLADGFSNLSGETVDASGQLYFIDTRWQRIYRWAAETRSAVLVSDAPLAPTELAFDRAGDLLVVSYDGPGTVYAFHPGAEPDKFVFLKPVPATPRPSVTAIVPVNYWFNERVDFPVSVTTPRPYHYVSPDGTTFIPAGADFVEGNLYYGAKMADVLRAFALAPAEAGKPFVFCYEAEQKTYTCTIGPDGTVREPKLFANQGGVGAVADTAGNIYIADGEVYVYDAAGHKIDTIDVPERPTGIVFGGADHRTLFILGRTALYSVETAAPGR